MTKDGAITDCTSDASGASVTKDGGNNHHTDVTVSGNDANVTAFTDGTALHQFTLSDGNVTKATFNKAGTHTTINSDGSIDSNITLVIGVSGIVKALVDGNATHEVIGTGFHTYANIQIKGAQISVSATGTVETNATQKVVASDADYYKAVITTDKAGKSFTKFNKYDSSHNLLQASGITINTTAFWADNNITVSEDNGTVIIKIITPVGTTGIEF